jgi:glycosyltransferase involved in cell wall biosynthesis
MLKILHIVAGVWKNSGGMATLVLGFSQAQAKAGHEVSLVFLEGDRHEGVMQAEKAGVRVRTFKRSFPHFLFFSWGMLFGLGKEVRAAEVVHIHSNWTFPVWWGAWLALRYKKTLVMSPQGCFDPVRLQHSAWKKRLVGWMDRWLLRRASVIHATCEGERAWIQAVLKCESSKVLKLGKPRIVVVPNGVGE